MSDSSHQLTRFNIFTGCPEAKTCTIILRGGAEQFIEETERSLHDAIMIVRRTIKNDAIVAGERWGGLYRELIIAKVDLGKIAITSLFFVQL